MSQAVSGPPASTLTRDPVALVCFPSSVFSDAPGGDRRRLLHGRRRGSAARNLRPRRAVRGHGVHRRMSRHRLPGASGQVRHKYRQITTEMCSCWRFDHLESCFALFGSKKRRKYWEFESFFGGVVVAERRLNIRVLVCRGTDELLGVTDRVQIVNSTLGKALGGAAGTSASTQEPPTVHV